MTSDGCIFPINLIFWYPTPRMHLLQMIPWNQGFSLAIRKGTPCYGIVR